MKAFVCHAFEDRVAAEHIALALRGAGWSVFLDKTDLPSADDFHGTIREAIAQSDRFVFLISPASVAPTRYTLSELSFAKAKWPHPKGAVLPVMVSPVALDQLDPYLVAVTVLEPKGNVAAEVCAALLRSSERRRWPKTAATVVAALFAALATIFFRAPDRGTQHTLTLESGETETVAFSVETRGVVEVTIQKLTPDWTDFSGPRGAPGQDGAYVRLCSAAESPCREGQIGVGTPFGAALPSGSGYVSLSNFVSSPRATLVVEIRGAH